MTSAEPTEILIRRSSHRSVNQLEDAGRGYIAFRNEEPKPFI